MKIYCIFVLLAGFGYVCLATDTGSMVCNQRYQHDLIQAFNIKQLCETAAFYDCCQIKTFFPTFQTGAYEIGATNTNGPFSTTKFFARCDMDADNGGWIVIQRRVAGGTVDFYRNWDDYELGFGNLDEEFWLGLQNIHHLTTRDEVELRIDLQDEQGNNVTWTYQEFRVDGPADNYRLHIGPGEGVGAAGPRDAMAHHRNMPFSTYDRDNDSLWNANCAGVAGGGWWYNSCYNANLNGPHISPAPDNPIGSDLVWLNGESFVYYPNAEMKVRRKSCQLI